MCYITPKRCIICTKTCRSDEYKNVSDCICELCKEKYNNPYCTQCNSQHCTQCKNRYYLDDDNKCTPCPKGYYCYQSNNSSIKSPCPKGSANNKIAQSVCEDCKKVKRDHIGNNRAKRRFSIMFFLPRRVLCFKKCPNNGMRLMSLRILLPWR